MICVCPRCKLQSNCATPVGILHMYYIYITYGSVTHYNTCIATHVIHVLHLNCIRENRCVIHMFHTYVMVYELHEYTPKYPLCFRCV